jgi:hypothetical protein
MHAIPEIFELAPTTDLMIVVPQNKHYGNMGKQIRIGTGWF